MYRNRVGDANHTKAGSGGLDIFDQWVLGVPDYREFVSGAPQNYLFTRLELLFLSGGNNLLSDREPTAVIAQCAFFPPDRPLLYWDLCPGQYGVVGGEFWSFYLRLGMSLWLDSGTIA